MRGVKLRLSLPGSIVVLADPPRAERDWLHRCSESKPRVPQFVCEQLQGPRWFASPRSDFPAALLTVRPTVLTHHLRRLGLKGTSPVDGTSSKSSVICAMLTMKGRV